jgi:hypothetical protein
MISLCISGDDLVKLDPIHEIDRSNATLQK